MGHYYSSTKEAAQETAAQINERLSNNPEPYFVERHRVLLSTKVQAYEWTSVGAPIRWGLVPQWKYADRDDLTFDSGGFLTKGQVGVLLAY